MNAVIALAGNPNSGKTTLFNKLTGLRQKVGNYPGVTVERRSGAADLSGRSVTVVDLPGTYSLTARSQDEAIAFQVLTGRAEGEEAPSLTVIVLDASNLDRNLYLALSILELGLPAVVALNMVDEAKSRGIDVDAGALEHALGVPVVPIVAKTGMGLETLRSQILGALSRPPTPSARSWRVGPKDEKAIASVKEVLGPHQSSGRQEGEAIWLLCTLAAAEVERVEPDEPVGHVGHLEAAIDAAQRELTGTGAGFPAQIIQARYDVATKIAKSVTTRTSTVVDRRTDRIDGVLLHPVWGFLVFVLMMALLFHSIFSWSEPLMGGIEILVGALQSALLVLPAGALRDLLIDGVVGGVGNVIVFVPQIAFLFFFITVLEDSGYLARAAFISDRLMARVGLHGKALVPLLSGFACAIPGILAARTIENKRDRLVTILVTPLVSCSARLPVYTLVIAALFSSHAPLFGFISVGALLFLAMYLLSIVMTIAVAFVLKRTLLKSPTPPLVLELPPYRMPEMSSVFHRVYTRCKVFVRDAGTVILACSIVLWALLYFPRSSVSPGELPLAVVEHNLAPASPVPSTPKIESSFAGQIGRAIEPLIEPLGFDWKIGVGLLASFAAREVMVSTLGLIYGVGGEEDEASVPLREALRNEKDAMGRPVYTPLLGLSLMVFFVLACQCMSTVAVVRKETGGWRWPLFMMGYMTALAWVGAFLVYQGGRILGFT